jgi:hypothetical protein
MTGTLLTFRRTQLDEKKEVGKGGFDLLALTETRAHKVLIELVG